MDITDLVLMRFKFPYFKKFNLPTVEIKPFDWMLLPERRIQKQYRHGSNILPGSHIATDYSIHFLFIVVYLRINK